MKNKAIFMDRDGVINKLINRNGKFQAPYVLSELELFPGVIEAFAQFKKFNFLTIAVTNQPDVARGWVAKDSVYLINSEIHKLIPLDDIKICFHVESDHCLCRKPMPGMILEAASEWKIDMSQSFMIGDRYSDVEAGFRAGCKTVLVGPGDIQGHFQSPHFRAESLLGCVNFITEKL